MTRESLTTQSQNGADWEAYIRCPHTKLRISAVINATSFASRASWAVTTDYQCNVVRVRSELGGVLTDYHRVCSSIGREQV